MDIRELNIKNQYMNTRMPVAQSEWIDHFKILSVAAGVNHEWFASQIKRLIQINLRQQTLEHDDPNNELKEFEEQADAFFKSTGDKFTELFGFNPIEEYDTKKMWTQLLKNHGKTKVVKRVYANEIIEVWNTTKKDPECFNQFLLELENINIDKQTVSRLIKSWIITDEKESAIAYRDAYLDLEKELVSYYKEMHSIDSDEKLKHVKMEHVVDFLILSNRFDQTDPKFSKYQLYYLPDIMIVKLCFSHAIQKTSIKRQG